MVWTERFSSLTPPAWRRRRRRRRRDSVHLNRLRALALLSVCQFCITRGVIRTAVAALPANINTAEGEPFLQPVSDRPAFVAVRQLSTAGGRICRARSVGGGRDVIWTPHRLHGSAARQPRLRGDREDICTFNLQPKARQKRQNLQPCPGLITSSWRSQRDASSVRSAAKRCGSPSKCPPVDTASVTPACKNFWGMLCVCVHRDPPLCRRHRKLLA